MDIGKRKKKDTITRNQEPGPKIQDLSASKSRELSGW